MFGGSFYDGHGRLADVGWASRAARRRQPAAREAGLVPVVPWWPGIGGAPLIGADDGVRNYPKPFPEGL